MERRLRFVYCDWILQFVLCIARASAPAPCQRRGVAAPATAELGPTATCVRAYGERERVCLRACVWWWWWCVCVCVCVCVQTLRDPLRAPDFAGVVSRGEIEVRATRNNSDVT